MHPELRARFDLLEARRHALIARVRELPSDKQTVKPDPRSFSPAEVLMHMGLAEQLSLARMRKAGPAELAGRRPKPSFVFRKVVDSMQAAKRSPGPPAVMPKGPVSVDQGEQKWAEVRREVEAYLEKAQGPDAVMYKAFPFGTLSASDLLTLFESHSHYHEVLFPRP